MEGEGVQKDAGSTSHNTDGTESDDAREFENHEDERRLKNGENRRKKDEE